MLKYFSGAPAKAVKIIALSGALFIAIFLCLNIIFPLPFSRIEEDYSVINTAANGELLRISLSGGGRYRIKLKLNEMSPYLVKGFLEYEDRYYYFHPGINPYAVLRAAVLNIKSGRIVSGGSTISQQTAKIIEPRKRTYGAKLIEAFRTIQLELAFSKKELLELYLNTIPMGGNIEGVGAASYLYFNKPAIKLTPAEAAVLIALPKSPNIYRPDRHPEMAAKARETVLRRIAKKLRLTPAAVSEAINEPVPDKRMKNPMRLPYLVYRNSSFGGFSRNFTVDMDKQAVIENMLSRTVQKMKKSGVYNGAVIVIDNLTMEVICYAGSADFTDKKHGGEINCANILRSPGSALKPFIYALAADKGIVTPETALFDIDKAYDGYTPANYERFFHGIVPVKDALTHSYNMPAVDLEYTLSGDGLYRMLVKCGFTDRGRLNTNPGLSVALGAFPITLEEAVMLYAALARGGSVSALKFTKDAVKTGETRLFSPEAAYMVTAMLADGERPDLPQSWEFTNYRGRGAFKTGTSFGLRDAWCIGYNPQYTAGVWLGNADASASFELVGIKAAAPLLIEIFNFFTRYNDVWFEKPSKIKQRDVCALSGSVPNPNCNKIKKGTYIEGVSSPLACGVHRIIYINKKNGLRAAPENMKYAPDMYTRRVVEDWPPEAAAFLRQKGSHLPSIPPYSPEEAPKNNDMGPEIMSPSNGNTYIISPALKKKDQRIMLKAAAAGAGKGKIVWFVNGKAYKESMADESIFMEPVPGDYEITAQDDAGRFDTVKIEVKGAP